MLESSRRFVTGGNGEGSNLDQLNRPKDIIVDNAGRIYVTHCYNHRIMRWSEGDIERGIVVGGNGDGQKFNQLTNLFGLSFDTVGNRRILKFDLIRE
ncbi:unnamed protein product [Adineta ricciae]|uniref:Uncharacterized protein n=1 Tax=Adineta ricciae TaxID=249248 RepID=A0A814ZWI1_ADIRI|nr:unnamed protein product [Adineta ricciae]